MKLLQPLITALFARPVIEKVIAFVLLIFTGWLLSDFLAIFFITFLFAYIFLEMGEALANRLYAWGKSGKRNTLHHIAERYSTINHIVTGLYIIFIVIVIFIFSSILPQILTEIKSFLNKAPEIASQGQEFIQKIESSTSLDLGLNNVVGELLSRENLETFGQKTISYITNTGILLTKFLIALILSYIFIIERSKIDSFLSRIKDGNFSFLYYEWSIVAKKVGKGFGMIFKAQSIIASVNAVLTSIGLIIISLIHGGGAFPYIFTLSLIVFIFGFIPVFGTFLSGIPIIIIAYGYGAPAGDSLLVVAAVLAMIAFVHALEAYYLNPRIVSSYVHFPIFITFLILLVSEHAF
jgi:predicted PurR-regulated permease PerM